MEFVNQDLYDEHRRWINKVSEESDLFKDCVICIADVLDAHFSIVDYFLDEESGSNAVGGIGPRDTGLLSSAVARQITSFNDTYKWKNEFEKCATLFYGLIKNHPFHDCNKRTAVLSLLYYLQKINRTPTIGQRRLEKLTLRVAKNSLDEDRRFKPYQKQEDGEIYYIARFLQKNSRKIDKRYYIITYHQLNSRLHDFDHRLENPQKNCIDIVKTSRKRTFFGLGREKIIEQRVGHIGFPGWTKEVARRDMKTVRERTGLTPKDGFDSEVFYRGAEPLKSLINYYSGLLKRLSNK